MKNKKNTSASTLKWDVSRTYKEKMLLMPQGVVMDYSSLYPGVGASSVGPHFGK